VVSFTFNGSGVVAVTIDGDGGYRISADEVCAAVVPLVWLDSCAPSDLNASVVLALFRVIAPPSTVPAGTTALSVAIVAGSVVAAAGSPVSAAGSMQRALTELLIAQCGGLGGEPLPLAESILQLRIGTDALSYRRGAVVGNAAFWAAAVTVAAVLVQQRARGVLRHGGVATDLSEAAASMRLPGALVVVYVPLLQPTVTSAVALLVESSGVADAAIAVLGVAACAAPIAWLLVPLVLRRPFGAVAHEAAASRGAGVEGAGCRGVLAALQSRRHRWRDCVRGSRFVRRYGAVFEEFVGGRQWFVLVDVSTEAVCGVLGALVDLPTQQGSGCAALKIAMVAVTLAYAAAVAVLRPSNTLMGSLIVSVNALAGVAGSVAVLLSPTLGPRVVLAQGAVAVILVLPPLVDLVLSGRALRRLRGLLGRMVDEQHLASLGSSSDSFGVDGTSSLAAVMVADEASGEELPELEGRHIESIVSDAGDDRDAAEIDALTSNVPHAEGDAGACLVLGETDVGVSLALEGPSRSAYRSELELLYDSLGADFR
jgi:hypothetical protein